MTPDAPPRNGRPWIRTAGGLALWALGLLFLAATLGKVSRPAYSSVEPVLPLACSALCFVGGAALLRPHFEGRTAGARPSVADQPLPRILEDARRRPDVFCWRGQVGAADLERIRAWLGPERPLPDDVWRLLGRTGGGDYFESATLLSLAPNAADDDPWDPIDQVNERFWSAGMPRAWVACSIGGWIAVVDTTTGTCLDVDESAWTVNSRHATFDAWYVAVPRAEFGRRYRLY